jgi:hypothetical protein
MFADITHTVWSLHRPKIKNVILEITECKTSVSFTDLLCGCEICFDVKKCHFWQLSKLSGFTEKVFLACMEHAVRSHGFVRFDYAMEAVILHTINIWLQGHKGRNEQLYVWIIFKEAEYYLRELYFKMLVSCLNLISFVIP